MPQLRWQTCLFITCNAVLLSMLLLDGPVGAGQVPPVIRRLGRIRPAANAEGIENEEKGSRHESPAVCPHHRDMPRARRAVQAKSGERQQSPQLIPSPERWRK